MSSYPPGYTPPPDQQPQNPQWNPSGQTAPLPPVPPAPQPGFDPLMQPPQGYSQQGQWQGQNQQWDQQSMQQQYAAYPGSMPPGPPKKMNHVVVKLIIFGAVLLLAVIATLVVVVVKNMDGDDGGEKSTSQNKDDDNDKPGKKPKPTKPTDDPGGNAETVAFGETIEVKEKVFVTVQAPSAYTPSESAAYQLKDGDKAIVLEATVKNESSEAVETLFLKPSLADGVKLSASTYSPLFDFDNPDLSSFFEPDTLEPGQTITAKFAFVVPADAAEDLFAQVMGDLSGKIYVFKGKLP